MFDYNDCVNGRLDTSLKFGNNTSEVFSGKEFLERQSISWTPWSYAIKKQFLREQKLKFCGGVLYEDVDFALGIIARSSSAKYIPLPLVRYTIRTGQTSKIGDSPVRVDYLFQLTERLNVLASQFSDSRKRIIQQQADFQLKQLVTRYLWRLKYKDIRILLSRYTGLAQRQGLANRIPFKAPVLYACLAILLGPSVKFIIKKIRG